MLPLRRRSGTPLARLRGAGVLIKQGDPFCLVRTLSEVEMVDPIEPRQVPGFLRLGLDPKTIVAAVVAELLARAPASLSRMMAALGSGSDCVVPMPMAWRARFAACGVRFRSDASRAELRRDARRVVLRAALHAATLTLRSRSTVQGPEAAVFVAVPPAAHGRGPSAEYTLVGWLRRRRIAGPIQDIYLHIAGKPARRIAPGVYRTPHALPRLPSRFRRFVFLVRAGLLVLRIAALTFGRRPILGYVAAQAVQALYVRMLPRGAVASTYLFNNSGWFIRPLWSHVAERHGARQALYYYSTNGEPFLYGKGRSIGRLYGIATMRWPNVLVWDRDQREYLQSLNPGLHVEEVGPVDFTDSGEAVPHLGDGPVVAVFDVTPMRPTLHTDLGYAEPAYYSEELVTAFLAHVVTAATEHGFRVAWKGKRAVDKRFVSTRFVRARERALGSETIRVPPGISARRLIENIDAVVSIPFTSTAIVAARAGKPSIYYDASGNIDHQRTHGIPLLQSRSSLDGFFSSCAERVGRDTGSIYRASSLSTDW